MMVIFNEDANFTVYMLTWHSTESRSNLNSYKSQDPLDLFIYVTPQMKALYLDSGITCNINQARKVMRRYNNVAFK